ncbi:16S rRNA (cytosine(1402)-N(4))-methyltransferase RsmH [Xiashengella succiniciproducens]|jgi:16S rRNA (cytosine1402-N4)-methyltransferase|uniref:Ribosomal RNA small subunit methyltransferase H n=1 Tax=Xiashengella succiniciproducens TaxID=2949635 RepID=A0A9J6ZS34_9BACT|nr:16S rRNA (cytosine(1402)-N(4))-methyltransferase RsmH [Alkaliflexus sp. Ai-910]MDI9538477.1 16S rRNA (cytosine(1402)-N(4))-methyltransferase RsmH [Bacteroidota bacterium]URW80409.1 16S rRNA (cytosine(1402)-N(4))-methyltransferase RsmH [Alkaliflexus sp. Ai-910]HHT99852.1 16S rRNA (cytosine(1402)-N(4))-methyltransferase RsmH [Bacteroidales bacterium]
MKEEVYHIPVLLEQSIEGLDIRPDGVYADLTFGGGGHSRAILERLGPKGRLIVFDQDEDAWNNRIDDERVEFVRHNFRFLYYFTKYLKALPLDGILADLGVSSHHFDEAERGFSFRFDGELDMRMNRNSGRTAADLVNTSRPEELMRIFRMYGELNNAQRLVQELVKEREVEPVSTTTRLREIASKFAPRKDAARYMGQVFQALRIEVNGEMNALREMLGACETVLRPGGRLVVISYHSLEDRMVKNFLKTGDVDSSEAETDVYGRSNVPFRAVNRKVIVPDDEELSRNPRARSAKLRIGERNGAV